MKRFKDVGVGDLVYHRMYGNGFVDSICDNCFVCFFKSINGPRTFYKSGKEMAFEAEVLLFYRKKDDIYLTERPLN